ncbi:hypothetical protein [Streptomyces sp. NPDC101455]|uniref:hypothetical protein n=1 Tax=Streptomyces sp. NPDC101455 TaxID=3366142 RepID=UPI00382460A4
MNGGAGLGELLASITAGPYTDPVTGERHVLIEHIDERGMKDSALLESVCTALHRAHPGAQSTLLRTPAGTRLPAPWRRHLTYVRCAETLPPVPDAPSVTPAEGPGDDELVRVWLIRAFVAAGDDMCRPVSEAVARTVADGVLARPDRVSLMARQEDRTVGHATLLTDRDDETTGETFAELVDILVDGADTGRTTAALSRAAAAYAHSLGRPLVGNVVHTAADSAGAGKDTWRIVTRLLRNGWQLDHAYWWAPAPAGEERP